MTTESKREPPKRVFLLLQNRLLRDELHRLLSRCADLLIVGGTKYEGYTPQKLIESECDLLVLDFLATQWLPANLRREGSNPSEPKILLISMSDDAEQFLAAVRGGVTGYLLNEASGSEIVSAVRVTSRGEAVCSHKLLTSLFYSLSNKAGDLPVARGPVLTLRQRRLVGLRRVGLSP